MSDLLFQVRPGVRVIVSTWALFIMATQPRPSVPKGNFPTLDSGSSSALGHCCYSPSQEAGEQEGRCNAPRWSSRPWVSCLFLLFGAGQMPSCPGTSLGAPFLLPHLPYSPEMIISYMSFLFMARLPWQNGRATGLPTSPALSLAPVCAWLSISHGCM